jgi:hypothetical protein
MSKPVKREARGSQKVFGRIRGQGPGLVNVLWAEAKTTTYFSRRTGHGSCPFNPQVMLNELLGWRA